jgi:hypothetical protein
MWIAVTSPAPEHTTQTVEPSGVIARSVGSLPIRTGVPATLLEREMGVMLFADEIDDGASATQAVDPFGVIAIAWGAPVSSIGGPAVLDAIAIGVTLPE